MSEKEMVTVPYFVYEGEQVRNERIIKALIVALAMAIVLLFLSNAMWLYAWNEYDYTAEKYTIEQDNEGMNNVNINSTQGDVNNGAEGDLYEKDTNTQE